MHFLLWTKGPMKIPILTLWNVLMKICQILHVIFQTTSQLFFKFCLTLQCHEIYSSVLFYVKRCILCTKETNQSANFLDFLVLWSKFTKFLSFLTKNKFLFKFCTSLWYHETYFLHTFFSWNFIFSKVAYQSTNLVKFHLNSWKSELLHCGGFLS